MVDRFLAESYQVTVFDNLSSGALSMISASDDRRCQIIMGDVLDTGMLSRCIRGHDLVCHLAANPDIAAGANDTSLDFRLSAVATHNVLEAMRGADIKRIIYTSGSGVYGDRQGERVDETYGPLLPVSLYGAGKLSAEALVSAYCHLFDMTAYIVRPANIVGGKQTHGVAVDFIGKLSKTPHYLHILGDGRQTKSYLHIDDFIEALFIILDKSRERVNLYNVATTDEADVNWIAAEVIRQMGLKNVELGYTGGDTGWKGDVPVVRMNCEKLRSLGWTARYNSKEALSKAIEELLLRMRSKAAVYERRAGPSENR